jgi:hypothetical protein
MMVSDAAPNLDIEVLNQHIDEDNGVYRIRAGQKVHYLHISTTVFDESTMCRPYLLIPQLPNLPATDWTTMCISPGTNGALESTISFDRLPAIRQIWHPKTVDVLSFRKTKMYRSAIHEVLYQGQKAISKIACFEWDIQCMDNETRAYSIINKYQQQHPSAAHIAPEFLAHLTENGRVIGMLLEKVEGDAASIDDLPKCREALCNLHGMGLVHGDVNRFNFMVDRAKDRVCLLDFESVEAFNEEMAKLEIESLSSELPDRTGRGNGFVIDL